MPSLSNTSTIELSQLTKTLLKALAEREEKHVALEGNTYTVSQAVSFFGFAYEKIRNAIEFHEEHLIRRHAIGRILTRRLTVNPQGKHEGENLVRELLWGRYVDEKEFSDKDVQVVQHIIDQYILLFHEIKKIKKDKAEPIGQRITELMSCEIEEVINKEQSDKQKLFLYYFYQTLRNKITIPELVQTKKDAYFYVAAERALTKNDASFVHYHLFVLRFGPLHKQSHEDMRKIAADFYSYITESSEVYKNRYADRLLKFARLQTPPFKILNELISENPEKAEAILTQPNVLHKHVSEICQEKYKQTGDKLRNAAFRSISYIFCTKMLFVLILEIPLTRLIYNHIDYLSIGVNTLFPPLFMGALVSVISPPSEKNTERIYKRIVEIIDADQSFETQSVGFSSKLQTRKPLQLLLFTLLYVLTFIFVFGFLYLILDELGFNLISKGIFIFFMCVVAFFAYRIRQTAKEYVLSSQNNIFLSIVTFLFLPILYVGKLLSEQVSRVNFFIIFFDYIIEAPFKFVIDIIEDWTSFLRERKDELV